MAMSSPAKAQAAFVILTLILAAVDLGTKALARLALRDDLELSPFLALRLRFNYASTFSIFPAQSAAWFVGFAIGAIGCLGCWYARRNDRKINWAIALVTAGGLGNLVDRMLRGNVTDFVAISLGNWRFPIFNLADVLMVVGGILLVIPGRRHGLTPSE